MRIFSLNYHEITEDPRVFKQARSLTDLGHDVTVFCDLKPGFREEETLHGVGIRRFAWRNLSKLNSRGLAHLRVFAQSFPIVEGKLERTLGLLDLRDKLLDALRDAHLLTEDLSHSLEGGSGSWDLDWHQPTWGCPHCFRELTMEPGVNCHQLDSAPLEHLPRALAIWAPLPDL